MVFNIIVIANNFNFDKIINIITSPVIFTYLIEALTLAVTIIIVSVPEGLPMMVTLVLSSNMRRMLKKNVLVRKLVGIETSGSLNMLFFDKTGTITKGCPIVMGILTPNLKFCKKEELKNKKIYDLLKLSLICNNESSFDENGNRMEKNCNPYKKYYKDGFRSKNL